MIHKIVGIVFRWASHFKKTTFLQGTEYCTTYNIVKHCLHVWWMADPGTVPVATRIVVDNFYWGHQINISSVHCDHSPRMETGCRPDGGGGGNHNLKGQYFPVTRMMDGQGSRDTVPSQLPMPITLYNTQPSSWCPFQWECNNNFDHHPFGIMYFLYTIASWGGWWIYRKHVIIMGEILLICTIDDVVVHKLLKEAFKCWFTHCTISKCPFIYQNFTPMMYVSM